MFQDRLVRYRLCWLFSGGLWACDSPSSAVDELDLGQISDGAPLSDVPVRRWDASLDAAVTEPDLGLPVEDCTPGQQQCWQEGGTQLLVCADDGSGFWPTACPLGTSCFAGRCVESDGCVVGDRACLGESLPAHCDAGVFVAEAPCQEGELCAFGDCAAPACLESLSRRSYLGCDYWVTDLPNARREGSAGLAPLGLIVTNPEPSAISLSLFGPGGQLAAVLPQYAVEPPAELSPALYPPRVLVTEVTTASGEAVEQQLASVSGLSIPPGGMATLLLPYEVWSSRSSGVAGMAWRLKADHPVSAYQFNPLCCSYSYSNDASLLLPTSALGERYRFVGIPGYGGFSTYLVVVGTQAQTALTFTLPAGVSALEDPEGRLVMGEDGRLRAEIGPYEVLAVASAAGPIPVAQRDLTGTVIESSSPVAVFTAHSCGEYPGSDTTCDHLEEQLFPVNTWGRAYTMPPLAPRSEPRQEAIYWRLVADEDQTLIQLSSPLESLAPRAAGTAGLVTCASKITEGQTITLNAGESCELATAAPFAVDADKPIMVMGVMAGEDSTGALAPFAGDPSIFLVPPERQFRKDYAFLTPDTYARGYVTVIAPPDAQIELDGALVALVGQPVPGRARVAVDLPLPPGPHHMVGDKAFGIIVYAFDDFVSYAFAGGLDLTKE